MTTPGGSDSLPVQAFQPTPQDYRFLLESAPDGILLGDPEGRILEGNGRAWELTGYGREELLGRPLRTVFPGDVLAPQDQAIPRERELLRRDGERLPVEVKAQRLPDGRSLAFFRDIAQSRRTERNLQEALKRLDLFFDLNPFSCQVVDPQGHTLKVNTAFMRLFGATPPATYSVFEDAKLQALGFQGLMRLAKEGETVHLPEMWYDPHEAAPEVPSRRVCIRFVIFPLRDPQGTIVQYILMHEDITDGKRAEEALQASEARHSALLAAIPDLLFLNARDGTYLACHAGDSDRLFMPPEAFLGRKQSNVLPPALAVSFKEATDRAFASAALQYLEYELPLGDGTHAFEARIVPASPDTYFTVVRDITQRQRAEQDRVESERRLATLMGNLPGMAYRCQNDSDWTMEFVSGGCLELTGYRPEELIGNRRVSFAALIHPGHRERIQQTWQAGLAKRERVQQEYPITTASGELKWVWEQGCGVFSESGEPEALEGFITDISARKRSEEQLRESERRYLDLYLNTPDSVFWTRQEEDGGFRVESVNPAQAALLGVPASAMEGRRLEEILTPDKAQPIAARYGECLSQGRSTSYEEAHTLGEPRRWFHTLLVPIRDAEGRMRRLVGFSRDITQKKTAEEALLQAQKLESLGVLAGGIAHDFNNLLTAVLGNVNLAQMQLSPESPAQPFLESLEKTVLKASELTKQMLAYSGKGRFVVKPHDMNLVVKEMTHLLQVSISKRIALRFDLEPTLPTLEADAAQIQQVVMNLVTNASDAIGDADGIIGIRTAFERLDEAYIASAFPTQTLVPGPYVILEVSDTGCGMSPEIQTRIFDPFFTTKTAGRGLGLSAMLGILRGHHGGLKIYSEPGRGTTFKLFFPASGASLAPDGGPHEEREALFEGLALVVDDEPVILETTEAALRHMGFAVLCARDGVEGLEVFRAHPDEVRLVLLDLTMPRLDGRETFQALRQLCPDLPVILSSGYSEQESVQGFLGKGLAGFIQKPYTVKALRAVVASVISKAPGFRQNDS